jgi:altronate hydrolase
MSGTESLSIRLHPADNVVVARLALMPGAALPAEGIAANASIPAGHKMATAPIKAGQPIRKYDQIIGFATADIAPGDHVHVHNVEMRDFERDYAFSSAVKPTDYVPEAERATFQGFLRPNGLAGTRNYIGILTSVNCSATVAKYIAAAITPEILAHYPNVDGVVALVHSTGCGMADTGEGYANLQRTLWGHARHPNFAGILMVGLGCEVNQIDFLLEAYGLERGPRFQTMTIQDIGGTRKTVDRGVEIVKSMLAPANEARRGALPASHLTLALQCGGSDAYSGITANPALGAAADLLVRHGGTAILSETPEIYGAEHLLTRRAIDRKTGEKLIERIRWWKDDYNKGRDTQINGVVSPGNQMGGLANIFEKSLGSSMKGGTGPLMEVYKYAEPVTTKGFVFMDTPGYDPVSATGQVAGGANLIAFTTGRGSMFGAKPVPSVKLATNTPMFTRLEEDMDINCGLIMDGEVSMQEMGERIFRLLLDTASGKQSKSEELGVGRYEFVPWQIGVMA